MNPLIKFPVLYRNHKVFEDRQPFYKQLFTLIFYINLIQINKHLNLIK